MGMLIFSGLAYVSERNEKETRFISMPQVSFAKSVLLLRLLFAALLDFHQNGWKCISFHLNCCTYLMLLLLFNIFHEQNHGRKNELNANEEGAKQTNRFENLDFFFRLYIGQLLQWLQSDMEIFTPQRGLENLWVQVKNENLPKKIENGQKMSQTNHCLKTIWKLLKKLKTFENKLKKSYEKWGKLKNWGEKLLKNMFLKM